VTAEDFLFEFLGFCELNKDGKIASVIYFDTDKKEVALAELAHRAALLGDDISSA
jgi:hypothetical protein